MPTASALAASEPGFGRALLAFALWVSLASALAAPHRAAALELSEIRLGVWSNDVAFTGRSGLSFPNPFRHRREGGANLNVELLLVSPGILHVIGAPRPRAGVSINTSGATNDVYVDLDWRYDFRFGLFGEAGLGGLWHDGELRDAPGRSELGSRFLFHESLELGWRLRDRYDLSLAWEHMSNASLARPNQGIDRFGLRLGWRLQ